MSCRAAHRPTQWGWERSCFSSLGHCRRLDWLEWMQPNDTIKLSGRAASCWCPILSVWIHMEARIQMEMMIRGHDNAR